MRRADIRSHDIPGRPNLCTGRASQDDALHNLNRRRAVQTMQQRKRVVMPPASALQASAVGRAATKAKPDDDDGLTPRERRREAMIKVAQTVLRRMGAVSGETAVPSSTLAQGMKIKPKAVANYLSFAVSDGRLAKVRRSLHPRHPSQTVDHYFIVQQESQDNDAS